MAPGRGRGRGRQVWNQDHSALIAIPDGWVVQGNGGTTFAREGNYNAMINLNLVPKQIKIKVLDDAARYILEKTLGEVRG